MERVDLEGAVLAVDGGGTRCRLALVRGERIETVETGPANVTSDLGGAVRALRDGLERLAAAVGMPPEALFDVSAYLGLAGVTSEDIARDVAAALPLRRARIEDDKRSAVRGALGHGDGYLAHCGTGSFFAWQEAGAIRLAGGWGHVLGDEASAAWVGKRLLGNALEATDERAASTALTDALLARFGGAAGVVAFAARATPAEFGALAPMAKEHAAGGNKAAAGILTSGASEITRSLASLGWSDGMPICLTGGLGPVYADWLAPEMQAALSAPQDTPLAGAISLARDRAGGKG